MEFTIRYSNSDKTKCYIKIFKIQLSMLCMRKFTRWCAIKDLIREANGLSK